MVQEYRNAKRFVDLLNSLNLPETKNWSEALKPRLAHAAGAGQDAGPSQVTSPQFVKFPQQFAGTHLYSWVERRHCES